MVPLHDIPYLKEGIAHLDAERLGLVGSRHRAAIVVAQYDDRLPVQLRTENPFAGGEEIVAVGKAYMDNYAEAYGETMGCGAG